MSTKANKPQWLLDAEKAIQNFKDTKYGKLTDTQINRINNIQAWNSTEEAQEARSEAGKIGGKKAVESGHLASLRTPENQSYAASISGKKHVESGFIKELSKMGGNATSDKFQEIRFEGVKDIANKMEINKDYKAIEIKQLCEDLGYKKRIFQSIYSNEFPELIEKIKGPKATSPSIYKKIK